MRLLIVCPRFPEARAKGDQVRAFHQIAHLSRDHDVTVFSGAAASSPAEHERLQALAAIAVRPVPRRRRALAAAGALLRGQPAQVGWMTPRRHWQRVLALAANADVVIANTVRSVRGPLPVPLVLDHVDALALNMARRAAGPEPAVIRLAARGEGALLRRWERRAARWAHAQVVTTGEDAAQLPPSPSPTVVPIAWYGESFAEPPTHHRDIDVIFTGSMRYPPNRAAAEALAGEILPRLLALRPQAQVWIVGRDAARLRLTDRVCVASDVPDVDAYLRRAKVAVAPLTGGTGAPNKVLEAAACGAAIVATPWVLACFDIAGAVAESPEEFAQAIDRLLGDDSLRRRTAQRARATLRDHAPDVVMARLEAALQDAAAGRHAPDGRRGSV